MSCNYLDSCTLRCFVFGMVKPCAEITLTLLTDTSNLIQAKLRYDCVVWNNDQSLLREDLLVQEKQPPNWEERFKSKGTQVHAP